MNLQSGSIPSAGSLWRTLDGCRNPGTAADEQGGWHENGLATIKRALKQ
jgi:hypothetical protein